MLFRLEIKHVQPIESLTFEVDLSRYGLRCIVGKNGAGKTTLAKAILNLAQADTVFRTSSDGVFDSASSLHYTLENAEYLFTYDSALRSVTTRVPVSAEHKSVVSVEMAAPYGHRFTFFQTLAEQDDVIRQSVVLGRYEKPSALIEFLTSIYQDQRFEELVEIRLRRGVCCCFVQPDKRYLREDYFSSGEYFLINLYRKVTQGSQLVVIDEIDISLDASTQARLAEQLRMLCGMYKSTVVFTSHSLALMQTLEPGELYFLERDSHTGISKLLPMSFNGVKSLMFGFKGFDRYILTEDDVLDRFLQYVIGRYCSPTFYSYQIICLGGHGYVTGLMSHNRRYEFLGPKEDVIAILDGDQAGNKPRDKVLCMPLQSVEKALWAEYRYPGFAHIMQGGENLDDKKLYRELIRTKQLSSEEIFKLLCDRHDSDMKQFAQTLAAFLCRPKA